MMRRPEFLRHARSAEGIPTWNAEQSSWSLQVKPRRFRSPSTDLIVRFQGRSSRDFDGWLLAPRAGARTAMQQPINAPIHEARPAAGRSATGDAR
jgi:hypothetical protein